MYMICEFLQTCPGERERPSIDSSQYTSRQSANTPTHKHTTHQICCVQPYEYKKDWKKSHAPHERTVENGESTAKQGKTCR